MLHAVLLSLFVAAGFDPRTESLPADQGKLLDAWYAAVGPKRAQENFGELVTRVGLVQLGKPYYDPPDGPAPELLVIALDSFQCVSFVESTLAVARCTWADTATHACFTSEIEAQRYRGGTLSGSASRMHYYNEWLSDNAERGRLIELTPKLGGQPTQARFDYVTTHSSRYPFLSDANVLQAFREVEARLDTTRPVILERPALVQAEKGFESGDVVGIISNKPGLFISHTGFILRGKDGVPHLLHASSTHKRVLLTTSDVANYIQRWPDRRGLMVYRPLPVDAPALQASRSTSTLSP